MSKKVKKRLLIAVAVLLFCVAVSVVGFLIFASDYYKADEALLKTFSESIPVKTGRLDNGALTYGDENSETGFIFYPGGKVEYTAYDPLMRALASKGVFCVLVKMPFNIAFFDPGAADEIRASFTAVQNWYIGGHSLGGSMAADNVADNPDAYKGLVLLGAYSISDISHLDIKVLSAYGRYDGVMNKEKYDECKGNLPEDITETVINGGNHAYFGAYGEQNGDGEATITNYKQISVAAQIIFELMMEQ